VRVTVDEPGQKPAPANFDHGGTFRSQVVAVTGHGQDAPATDQQVLHATILRRKNAGVGE
jgi:hypothetical protein